MSEFEQAILKHEQAIKPILDKQLHPFWEQNEIRELLGFPTITMGQWTLQNRYYKNENDGK